MTAPIVSGVRNVQSNKARDTSLYRYVPFHNRLEETLKSLSNKCLMMVYVRPVQPAAREVILWGPRLLKNFE